MKYFSQRLKFEIKLYVDGNLKKEIEIKLSSNKTVLSLYSTENVKTPQA